MPYLLLCGPINDCILISGGGFPCTTTKTILSFLDHSNINFQFHFLGDSHPSSFHILQRYRKAEGDKNSLPNPFAIRSTVNWLGITKEDVDNLGQDWQSVSSGKLQVDIFSKLFERDEFLPGEKKELGKMKAMDGTYVDADALAKTVGASGFREYFLGKARDANSSSILKRSE